MLIQAGCKDCTFVEDHPTKSDALLSINSHVLETGHWPMISDNNGWHYLKEQDI
jgi:hypothetical protein